MKNRLLTLASAMVLLVVVGKFYAQPLLAQVRAALVQNVDERGRVPYKSGASCFGALSGSFAACNMLFDPVPAKTRLVVEHVSGTARFVPGAHFVTCQGVGGFHVPQFVGRSANSEAQPDNWNFNERVLDYYGPGETPHFQAVTTGQVNMDAIVTGYLVSLP